MISQIRLENFPIIHDIPTQYLWIPPALALGGYILPGVLEKIFPMRPDDGPLSKWRYQFAQIHYNDIKFIQPKYYQLIHVDLKDNLPLMLFFVSLCVLKNKYKDFQNEKLFLAVNVFVGCLVVTLIRRVTDRAFSELSKECRRKGLDRISGILENIAKFITPSKV